MDPGQADAAAYGGGCECSSGADEGWARALLRRGWALSRKAAIAGVAATAAPVVVPQIIILSIAGVALSVPFAVCLASVAAADRLTAALLPPVPPPGPCYYTPDDLGYEESSEQECVDAASGALDVQDAPVYGRWSKTEEDAVEQDEGFPSLPLLSRELRISEEPIPLLANEEDDTAEGEYASQNPAPELFVPTGGKQDNGTDMDVDNEYITMDAPSPGLVSLPELRQEDNIVRRMEEDAPVPDKESAPELPVSENENKTEDGKSTITVGNESSKEMLLPGVHTVESSDLALPMLGGNDVMVQRYLERVVSVDKSEQGSRVSDGEDKTEQHETSEVIPPTEIGVSELQGPDDNTVRREIALKTAPKKQMRDTNPVTQELSRELQAMTETAPVHDTLGRNVREGAVKHTDNESAEGLRHYAEGGSPCMVTVEDNKNLISGTSRPNVSAIGDGMTSVGSKPDVGQPNQTTRVPNKGHGKEKLAKDKCVKRESKTMDDNVPTTDIAAWDDSISKSLVLDDQAIAEDQATVEIVQVEVDIIARESETQPLSDLVAHELQVVIRDGTVEDQMEDIVKDINDTIVVDVDPQGGECASSFVSVTSVLTMVDGDDGMSHRSTPYVSAISDDMTSVEGREDLGHYHQTTGGAEYKLMDKEFETSVLAEGKDIYTEEQLREQLNTLRTITGYRAAASLTLEGELANLYIFVGVEPPASSGGASSLTELNSKLRFLKSIIGVE